MKKQGQSPMIMGTVPVLMGVEDGDRPRVDGCEMTAFFSASDAKSNVDSTQMRGLTVSSAQYFPISAQTAPQKPLRLFKKSSLTLQHRDSISPKTTYPRVSGRIPQEQSPLLTLV